jgi:hypothetical protein
VAAPGLGIAVLLHALSIFKPSGKSAVKEKMIEKEMKKQTSNIH